MTIFPPFESKLAWALGDLLLRVTIREPFSREDREAVRFLEQFHYRRSLPFGRRGLLVAMASIDEGVSHCIGLVELASPPLCNKARDEALNAPFNDGGTGWTAWDFRTRGEKAMLVANISRVVVHPDFRGLGVSTALMRSATCFARDYWMVRGQRPLFLEIVADMLKFHPFPLSAGFRFVGLTEGNLSRLAKDMKYYLREEVPNVDSWEVKGVVRMQRKYARILRERGEQNGLRPSEVLRRFGRLDSTIVMRNLDLFQGIARFPKPVFMIGLTETANRFLDSRCRQSEPPQHAFRSQTQSGSIVIEELAADVSPLHAKTRRAKEVRAAFDYNPRVHSSSLFSLTATIPLSSKVLVTGRSGSGKTTLLRVIAGHVKPTRGRISRPSHAITAMPMEVLPKKPMIECFGGTVGEAIWILNSVGLCEPRLYLSRYEDLSEGERERARLATLLASEGSIWLVDEFGAHLDEVTLRILGKMLSRLAARTRATVIVSTNRAKETRTCFDPDIEIQLDLGRKAIVFSRTGESLSELNLESSANAAMYPVGEVVGGVALAHG